MTVTMVSHRVDSNNEVSDSQRMIHLFYMQSKMTEKSGLIDSAKGYNLVKTVFLNFSRNNSFKVTLKLSREYLMRDLEFMKAEQYPPGVITALTKSLALIELEIANLRKF